MVKPKGLISKRVESVSMKHLYKPSTIFLIWSLYWGPRLREIAILSIVAWVRPSWTLTKWVLTELSSCYSMLTPPRSLQIITIPPYFLSKVIAKYNSFLKKVLSTTKTELTFLPLKPVCLVISVLPIILLAISLTSSGEWANWTPLYMPLSLKKPLPLPPAWI